MVVDARECICRWSPRFGPPRSAKPKAGLQATLHNLSANNTQDKHFAIKLFRTADSSYNSHQHLLLRLPRYRIAQLYFVSRALAHLFATMATDSLITSLKTANLLPSKIIPDTFTPTVILSITFPSISPSEGSFVRVSDVKSTPTISISSPTPSPSAQSFTFMLIDPDAPTPDDPKFAYWRHWVVTSISSAELDASNILASGTTLTPYLAPGPKDESGPHRYLFLLFKEPEALSLGKADVGGEEFVDRRSFGAAEFVEKWGLELVGVQWMRGVGDGWKGDEKSEL